MKNTYVDSKQLDSVEEIEKVIVRNIPSELEELVMSVAMTFPDYETALSTCLRFCSYEDSNVRAIAILGFGHIARRFRKLDKDKVLPLLEEALLSEDENIAGRAWSACDDITHFLGWSIQGFEEE